MVKLNRMQRKALKVLIPWDDTPGLIDYLGDENTNMRGLSRREVIRCAHDFWKMGLLKSQRDGDGDMMVSLSSELLSYFADSRAEIAKAVAKHLLQLLVGASGGAAVFLLQRLLP